MSLLLAFLLFQAVPGATWTQKTPAETGLSRENLAALAELTGGRGCVVRGGWLVYSWGDVSMSAEVASAGKPVLSTLLMAAIQEGKLPGPDARVSEVEPRLTGKNAEITWRHLAYQVSGYGLEERPGEAWSDNDYALALYHDTLMGKVFARPGTEVLRRCLGEPLQFQDPYGFQDFGEKDRPGRLAISAHDFARYGLLILRGGSWSGKQLLAPGLTYLSISAPLSAETPPTSGADGPMIPGQRSMGGGKSITKTGPGCYSYHWWLNGIDDRRRMLFVDGPADLVAALGHGGKQALWILPSLDLIVSWNDSVIADHDRSPGNGSAKINQAVRRMVECVLR